MPNPTWYPTVAEVAAVTASRTIDNLGNEVGTFNTDTRPTAVQVDSLINTAAQIVVSKIGTTIPLSIEPIAKSVIAIRAAMLIELTYFPEQTKGDNYPYVNLRDMFKDQLDMLIAAYNNVNSGDVLGAAGVGGPEYGFPDVPASETQKGMIGWGTRW